MRAFKMNTVLYGITALLLILSYQKDKGNTKIALKKAWKAFENILPEFMTVLVFAGILLAILSPETISRYIGASSGFYGTLLTALIGAITLIPGFIAFPMAALLLKEGAGYMQIGAFISTLMMVGVITIPVEIRYFGKKVTFVRNGLAFLLSFLIAFILGGVMNQ